MVACHAAGIRCHAWTVNDAEDMRRLLAMGIDAIITNEPALAIAVRAEMEKR
ncbi:MAG: glycerophosphodiester phosphodiesterase [Prevotella sp.]